MLLIILSLIAVSRHMQTDICCCSCCLTLKPRWHPVVKHRQNVGKPSFRKLTMEMPVEVTLWTALSNFVRVRCNFWGAKGAPILFSDLGFCMASCSYIYISVTKWRRSGFHEFTKLLFALSSFAQPFDRIRSIQEHIFIILSHRQACAGRFREETAGKRRGPVTK